MNSSRPRLRPPSTATGGSTSWWPPLRKSGAFVPGLSLVAETDGILAGHILFTEIRIGGRTALALAPLSVLPAYQRRGVGSALIAEGHRAARELRYPFSVVLGSERYYPKFGYLPAERFGHPPAVRRAV